MGSGQSGCYGPSDKLWGSLPIVQDIIQWGVRRERYDMVLEFIEDYPHYAKSFTYYFPILNEAIRKGRPEIFKLFIAKAGVVGTALNRKGPDGRTLLMVMAANNDENTCAMMKIIVEEGKADVNVSSFGHWTALHHAAANLNDKSISTLLEMKANPNVVNDDLWSPLMLVLNAAEVHPNKRARMVSAFTQHKVDVNVKGPKQITPLMIASLKCKADIVQMLLEQGANWDEVEDVKQNTPLHFSTIHGDVEAVSMILQKNAQNEAVIDKQNKWGYTALMYCAFLGSQDHLKIATLLLDDGADWDLVDHADMSAYKIASAQKNVLFLSENGVPMAKADVADPAVIAAIKASQERANRLGQQVRERERDLEEIREAEAKAEANRIQREHEMDKEEAEAIAAQEAYEKEAKEAREADEAAAAAKKKEEKEAMEAAREQREAEEAALAASKEKQEAEAALKDMNEAEKNMKALEGQEGYDAAKQEYEDKKAVYDKELAEADEAKIVADREKQEAVDAEKKRKEAEREAKEAAEIAAKENKEADEALLTREKEKKEAEEAAAMFEAAKKAEENLEKQIESSQAALEKDKAELEAEKVKLEELHDAAEDGTGVMDEDGNLQSMKSSSENADYDAEGNPMLHKGILQKKADLMGTWKNRQFVLEKGILRFYENHSSDYPFGTKFKNFMLVDETMSIFTADNPENSLVDNAASNRTSGSTFSTISSRMTMFGGGSQKAKPGKTELLIVHEEKAAQMTLGMGISSKSTARDLLRASDVEERQAWVKMLGIHQEWACNKANTEAKNKHHEEVMAMKKNG